MEALDRVDRDRDAARPSERASSTTSSGTSSATKSLIRSLPSTVAPEVTAMCDDSPTIGARGGATLRSRAHGSCRGRPGARCERTSRRPDRRRGRRRGRRASPRVPPPGPATPVTATATSAPSRSRAPAAIAAATSADTAPCSAMSSAGTPSPASFTPFAYATTDPRNTSLEPGTPVSRDATMPPVHDSAVARVSPRE